MIQDSIMDVIKVNIELEEKFDELRNDLIRMKRKSTKRVWGQRGKYVDRRSESIRREKRWK